MVKLCLTGDLMCGRGIDQILGRPGDPRIDEQWMRSATGYVELAEERSGPIPRGMSASYVWGDLLPEVAATAVDAFVVNLETAVTDRGAPWPGKGIQYRMHPANVGVLTAAGVDVAVLANNHVLDWSVPGLDQTVDTLRAAGIATVGAGRNQDEAWMPAAVDRPSGPRTLVVAAGTNSSGIPPDWEAGPEHPGVAMLGDLSETQVERIAGLVRGSARPGDVVVVSLHWGGNWGHRIPTEHRRFAHALIERAGVHVVHGHSSHHPLGIEVHRGRLILYGCGDLLSDYEGIGGHESYRGDLGALYLASIDPTSGAVQDLTLVPSKVERFQLTRPPTDDIAWMAETLTREGSALGTAVVRADDGLLHLRW